MTGICRTDLHAMHVFVDNEFLSVHWAHDQNSPLRRVISSLDEIDLNFEPPHTTQAFTRCELTRVHFLHVHSSFGGEISSTNSTSSSRSCSNEAIGTSTICGTSSKI